MTTIAVKDGILAVDSQISAGNERVGEAVKWRFANDGSVLAWCGEFAIMEGAFDWYDSGANYDNVPQDFANATDSALVALKPDGKLVAYYRGREEACFAENFAFGSGSQFARGAMEAGASAVEAVEITCNLDVYTGGDVYELTPQKPKPPVVRSRWKRLFG